MPLSLVAFLRGTVAYAALLLFTRLLGKRQVSQLTFFDYVVGITIGSIAGSFTTDLETEASVHWTGLLTWTLWTLVLGVITVHSRKLSKVIDGEPTIVIQNGKILERNLEKLNFAIDDLRAELREKSVFNLADVEFALLEPNGKLSVLKKSQLQPVTPADLNIPTSYKGLATELIVDGHIIEANLRQVNLDVEWLKKEIQRRNHRIEDVYYAELDTEGNLYVDLRDELQAVHSGQQISDVKGGE